MVHLAQAGTQRSLRKQQLADASQISADYVAQILILLRNGGLVRSRRGVQGGFVIARAPGTISVADIVEAVDGPICLAPCLAQEACCPRQAKCVTRPVWQRATDGLRSLLAEVSLKQLAEDATRKAHKGAPTFEI